MTDFATYRRMMVDTQVRPSDVTKFPIIDALLHVPREQFVPDTRRSTAYAGEHLPLGPGRVILDPRSFAKMLDALDIQPDELVLDLGCGLGYSAAVIARLAEMVIAVEEEGTLAAEAETLLAENGVDNAVVVKGALSAGAAKHGPYDVVVVEGAVEQLPDALVTQIKEGGRIAAIFMQGRLGVCKIGYKISGEISWRSAFETGAPVIPGFEEQHAFVL